MYTLLIVKMFNSFRLVRCGPPANYVGLFSMHFPTHVIALLLSPPLPRLTCIVV